MKKQYGLTAQGDAMTTVYQKTLGSENRSSPPSRASALLKFADLDDLQVVVIHTGEQASRDAGIRATLQRAHNDAIAADNPIDPELEPEQVLYVGPAQLDEGGKRYRLDLRSEARVCVP